MAIKSIFLNWLANDDLKKVFQGLFSLAEKYKDEQLHINTSFQSGRLKALEEKRIKNLISLNDEHIETAKIRNALMSIIQNLPDDWTLEERENMSIASASQFKSKWKKYAAYFAAAIALLAGIAELSGYNLRDIFQKNGNTATPNQIQPSTPKASTTGENSPAIITDEGNVNINYGESKPKNDSINQIKTSEK